ncbi:MAG: allantoinase AllB [Planctomycetes bacterium]|nr:allantoinase AllB [Planctomycetota bacterium]
MLFLRNARLVDESGVRNGGLLIEGETIVAIVPDGERADADVVVDCRGRYVLPGGIDVHVHANHPGNTGREDFASLTAAAAAGGVTCVVDMPIDTVPPPVDGASLAAKLRAIETESRIDFALWGGYIGGSCEDMAELDRGGVAGFKTFMVDSGDDIFPPVSHDALRRAMAVAADMGKPILVHAEDQGLASAGEGECRRYGRNGLADFLVARSDVVENLAVADALRLAGETGCRVHICHASTPAAVRRGAAARRRGVNSTAETYMHYLMFSADDMRGQPNLLKCLPPLRATSSVEGLWTALMAGDIDIIASDHSPCEPWEKAEDKDIWTAWGGINGVQATLPLLYSEGVAKRGLPLDKFTNLTAANPARLAGLYPRKGTLQVGSDADIVMIDPDEEWRWTRDNWFSKQSLSPYIGMSGRGAVAMTMVRGIVVYDGREVLSIPGLGRFYAIV